MRANIADDFADALKQSRVVKHRLADSDAILAELAGIAEQTRRISQRPYRNRPVIGGHATKLVTGNEGCFCPQVSGANRCHHSGGASANDNHVYHLFILMKSCELNRHRAFGFILAVTKTSNLHCKLYARSREPRT